MVRQTATEIDEAAAGWAASLDRGLTRDEAADLDAWLRADPRHLGAFGRMQALSLHTERASALGLGYRADRFRARRAPWLSRRQLFGASAMAAAGVAAVGSGLWFTNANGHLTTRRGEVRVVPLSDGSVITLNTDSAVAVRYSGNLRAISLTRGEALFDVAKDPSRPFVVSAGDVKVRAVGTSFTVRRLEDMPVRVLVQEGVVEVARRSAQTAKPIRLAANMRAVADAAGPRIDPVSPTDVGRELAWRQGRIAFEGQPLAEAAAEFSRYSDTRIVIEDPRLAREEISGMFQANDPVGFGRAVAEALGTRVEVTENQVRLFR